MGKIGDMIDVGPGTPEHEVNTVKAFGSIICATPLQNDHPAGTVVAKAAKPAAPAPVPAPAMEPVAEPLLPAVPPLMPLATTSQLIPSYSMVATPQQSYTYAEPVTTSLQPSYSMIAAPVASYGYAAPATAPAMYAPATPAYGFQVGQSINYQARSNGMWYPGRINGRSGNGWQVMLNDGLTKEVGDHEMGRLQPL